MYDKNPMKASKKIPQRPATTPTAMPTTLPVLFLGTTMRPGTVDVVTSVVVGAADEHTHAPSRKMRLSPAGHVDGHACVTRPISVASFITT